MSVLLTALAAGGGLLTGILTRAPAWIIASGLLGLAALAAWLASAVPAGEALTLYLAFCAGLSCALCLALAKRARERRAQRAGRQDAAADRLQAHGARTVPSLFDGGRAQQ